MLTDAHPPSRPGFFGGASVQIGPVGHVHVDVGGGRTLTCIETGLLLLTTEHGPAALLVSGDQQAISGERKIRLQAIAPERATSEQVLADIDAERRKRNVYRGRTISFHVDGQRSLAVRFHDLPKIERDAIILPAGVLERVETHSIVFAEHAERLRAAGRHLRRGLLLHGPPGTGKTLTAMYLAGQLDGAHDDPPHRRRARAARAVGARSRGMLQPSLVVLEDVDLVAEERTPAESSAANTVLFELLNQMDGLAEDADVIFLLTTNRPDLLEPALASRPGRVDQAIEIPLPDADVPATAVRALRPTASSSTRRRRLASSTRTRGRERRVHPRAAAQGGAALRDATSGDGTLVVARPAPRRGAARARRRGRRADEDAARRRRRTGEPETARAAPERRPRLSFDLRVATPRCSGPLSFALRRLGRLRRLAVALGLLARELHQHRRRGVAHLVERRVVQVADRVAGLVVAAVVRLAGDAAVDGRLLGGLDALGAREEAAGRERRGR